VYVCVCGVCVCVCMSVCVCVCGVCGGCYEALTGCCYAFARVLWGVGGVAMRLLGCYGCCYAFARVLWGVDRVLLCSC